MCTLWMIPLYCSKTIYCWKMPMEFTWMQYKGEYEPDSSGKNGYPFHKLNSKDYYSRDNFVWENCGSTVKKSSDACEYFCFGVDIIQPVRQECLIISWIFREICAQCCSIGYRAHSKVVNNHFSVYLSDSTLLEYYCISFENYFWTLPVPHAHADQNKILCFGYYIAPVKKH